MCKCGQRHGIQIPEGLKDLLQARDALVLLCSKGYKLQDMLDQCNKDIDQITDCI